MIIVIALVVLLAGCATTQPPREMSNLHVKYTQLDRRIKAKEQKIEELESKVRELSDKLESLEAFSMGGSLDGNMVIMEKGTSQGTSAVKSKSVKDDIIRVSATKKEVQQALKNAGYYQGAIDGKIGQRTKDGIIEFQKDHGLVIDGIIGQKTWTELKSYIE